MRIILFFLEFKRMKAQNFSKKIILECFISIRIKKIIKKDKFQKNAEKIFFLKIRNLGKDLSIILFISIIMKIYLFCMVKNRHRKKNYRKLIAKIMHLKFGS